MKKYISGMAAGLILAFGGNLQAQNDGIAEKNNLGNNLEIQRLHNLGLGLVKIISPKFDSVVFSVKYNNFANEGKANVDEPSYIEWLVKGYQKTKVGVQPQWGINLKSYCRVYVFLQKDDSSKARFHIETSNGEVVSSPKMDYATANAAANLLENNLSYNQEECEDYKQFVNKLRGK